MFKELLGYEAEELAGLTYRDITPAQWHDMEEHILRDQVQQRDFSDVYEKEYRRKDGTIVPVELRTFQIRDDDGQPAGMWAIIRDITKRKQAEAALKEQEDQLAKIYENAPLIMVLVDRERRVRKMNKLAEQFAGKEASELIGKYGGEALGCLHALDDPQGCGFGQHCQQCTGAPHRPRHLCHRSQPSPGRGMFAFYHRRESPESDFSAVHGASLRPRPTPGSGHNSRYFRAQADGGGAEGFRGKIALSHHPTADGPRG